MDPTPLVGVLDDLWRWSVWNEPRKLWFNGHLLRVGEIVVVVDPVPMSDEVLAAIEAIGRPALCVVTNRDHERAAEQVRVRWGTRILVPQLDAATMTVAGEPLGDGDAITDELVAVAVADGKSPGELAVHWPQRRLLVVGDAAIGRPSGALSMLPADKFVDPAAARAAVARLADLDLEIVLVGDGDDLLSGGSAALRAL